MKTTFTPEQSALVARIWVSGENIKPYLDQLGNRPYSTVVCHALKTLKLGPRPKSNRGKTPYAWDLIAAALRRAPGTAPEIAKRTGMVWSSVNKYLCPANAGLNKVAHIVDWAKRSNGGKPVPVYALGPGKNAPMPLPFTGTEKCQMGRARKRAASNPFAAAAGLVSVPCGAPGRVYRLMGDEVAA